MASLPRNVVTIGTVLVALALGSVINDRLPQPGDIVNAPAVHAIGMGEPIRMQTGTVTVTALDASPVLGGLLNSSRSPGTFLVLTLDFTAASEPTYLDPADLRLEAQDGRTFRGGAAAGSVCGSQPGLTVTCQMAVEVDPAALAGGTLIVPAEGWVFGPPVLEEAHLAIDEAKAAELAARTEPIHIVPSRPKGA